MFQKAVTYIKEVMDIGLFAVMSDAEVFMIFSGSPLSCVLLPMLAILFTILTLINGYDLFKANNKNIDKVLGFIVSVLCCALTSASLYGAVIANVLDLTFSAGPWLFLTSISLALAHQVLMTGLNAFRAYESLKGSAQRMHYIQAVFRNVLNVILIAVVTAAVVFVMLTPIAPAIGSACALIAVALTGVNILWRVLPDSWKDVLKGITGFAKPTPEMSFRDLASAPSPQGQAEIIQPVYPVYKGIFVKYDHVEYLAGKDAESGRGYLGSVINRKIAIMKEGCDLTCEKNKQKMSLLEHLRNSLQSNHIESIATLSKDFPLAFQSFWAEQGEVEQIARATVNILERLNEPLPINVLQKA